MYKEDGAGAGVGLGWEVVAGARVGAGEAACTLVETGKTLLCSWACCWEQLGLVVKSWSRYKNMNSELIHVYSCCCCCYYVLARGCACLNNYALTLHFSRFALVRKAAEARPHEDNQHEGGPPPAGVNLRRRTNSSGTMTLGCKQEYRKWRQGKVPSI